MTTETIQIGLSSSFTLNELKRELEGILLDSPESSYKIVTGQFNNFAAAMGEDSYFNSGYIGFEIHLYFLEDVFQNDFSKLLSGEKVQQEHLLKSIDQAVGSLISRANRSNSKIILCLDTKINLASIKSVNFIQKKRASAFITKMNSRIHSHIAESENILLFQINDLVRKYESGDNIDWRKEFLFRNPFSLQLSKEMALSLSTLVRNFFEPRTHKVLALDCDNTLWGGVVGEDGIENIQLGEDFPGRCYRKFQYDLLNLKNSGIILCLLSKNNLEDVKEVFETHDGMVLKWEDITSSRINWDNKARNLQSLAAELNLGIDSFIFVDDSEKEIAEMIKTLPEVKSIQLPTNLEDLPSIFEGISSLNPLYITREDVGRSKMMRAEKDRAELLTQFDELEFLSQLNLELDISVINAQDVERVSQLVAKTNQFNLTTKRFSANELNDFLVSSHKGAVVARLRDRFGDYGLIGVVFLENLESAVVNVSNFIVSCRALGRGVELPILSEAIRRFASQNQAIHIERLPNSRNIPAIDFLGEFNLQEDAPVSDWSSRLGNISRQAPKINIKWTN
jgi:FkbH-like protein